MFIDDLKKYDGNLLHHRFAFKYFRKACNAIGDIIVFRGEMEVLADAMIDQEDVMSEAFIWSEDAINILWELPILANSPFGAVAYQRLFNAQLAKLLAGEKYLNTKVDMDGDDIMVMRENLVPGKASVSITHVKEQTALGHTGINIKAGAKAPSHAYSTELSDKQIKGFCDEVINLFYTMNQDIFIATSKILS